MRRWLQDFFRDEAGLTAMEYALLFALIGVVAAVTLVALEGHLREALCMLETNLPCP